MTHEDSRSEKVPAAGISKTAIWVAAGRAIGAREPDSQARNPDYLAEKLLGDSAGLDLDHTIVDALSLGYEDAMQDLEVGSLVRAMVERTRFIDELLERRIAAGATQLLILGAGFDSHAYRFADLLARVSVFEVDRPATLAFKMHRVDAALGGPPANLTYVPVDFRNESLSDVLRQHGYDPSQQTFVIMEGVTMYLPEEDVRATFRFVASHAPGSSIVFDFAPSAAVEGLKRIDLASLPPAARPSMERFLNLFANEPWFFGLTPGSEREFLAELGLELGEVLTVGGEESVGRYLTRADGTTVGAEAHSKGRALRAAMARAAAAQAGPQVQQTIEERMREQERQQAYRIAEAVVARR